MVQIADTQERWSTHSLASRRVCHDGRTDGWMDVTEWIDGEGEEEKRREEEGDER